MTDREKQLQRQLDERNEATKVWIQSDTQCRAYANRLETRIEDLEETLSGLHGQCITAEAENARLSKLLSGESKIVGDVVEQNEKLREAVQNLDGAFDTYNEVLKEFYETVECRGDEDCDHCLIEQIRKDAREVLQGTPVTEMLAEREALAAVLEAAHQLVTARQRMKDLSGPAHRLELALARFTEVRPEDPEPVQQTKQ